MCAERSVPKRFGGDWYWDLGDGQRLNIGEAIVDSGPGKGFAMTPWVLDEYEKVLRLRPGESWLLRRLLKHAWEHDGLVHVSLRAIEFRSCVSRPTLQKYIQRLEELGYIRRVADGNGHDRRVRYDVSGLYAALALCIAADPTSSWAKKNGGALPLEVVRSLGHTGPHAKDGKAVRFNLDFRALQELVERKQRTGEWLHRRPAERPTDHQTAQTPPETTPPEREAAAAAAVRKRLCAIYAENIGRLTPAIEKAIGQYLSKCPGEWIEDAIREAAGYNVRHWGYVKAILDSWLSNGRQTRDKATPGQGHPYRQPPVNLRS